MVSLHALHTQDVGGAETDVFAGLFYKPHPLKAGLQLHRLFQLKIMLQIKMCQNYHSLEQILLISQMS